MIYTDNQSLFNCPEAYYPVSYWMTEGKKEKSPECFF